MGGLAKILAVLGLAQSPPDKSEIVSHAQECGLQKEQLRFSVDDEGVLNVDVFRLERDGEDYLDKVECFSIWAVDRQVPLGISNKVEN